MTAAVSILPFDVPDAGTALAVAPDVYWIRMPLPFQLDHINLWLLDDGDGWTMVDTGVIGARTTDYWERILDAHLGGRPLHRLVCTHCHPDHMGLAGWVCERWGAELWTSAGEWGLGRRLSTRPADRDLYRAHYRACGCLPEDFGDAVSHIGGAHAHYVPVPEQYRRLAEGDSIRMAGCDWTVMVTLGHSVEHVCLYCAELNLLIGGDQFLPKITPALVVPADTPDASPLRLFLDSNRRFRDLPAAVRVLPSHNLPFEGLAARIGEYERHHEGRLDATLAACAEPASCIEVARKIFSRPIDGRALFFAIGETLSHLRYLEDDGMVLRAPGRDGILRFSRV